MVCNSTDLVLSLETLPVLLEYFCAGLLHGGDALLKMKGKDEAEYGIQQKNMQGAGKARVWQR